MFVVFDVMISVCGVGYDDQYLSLLVLVMMISVCGIGYDGGGGGGGGGITGMGV